MTEEQLKAIKAELKIAKRGSWKVFTKLNHIESLISENEELKRKLDRVELAEAKARMENERLRAALQEITDICDKSEHIRFNVDLGRCEDVALQALEEGDA